MKQLPQIHHLIVFSDLHLGGRPAEGDNAGFQMCLPESRRRLAGFIHRIAAGGDFAEGDTVEIIINGDFIDFLAEEPFEAFTIDPGSAVEKVNSAIRTCDAGAPAGQRVFSALQDFVSRGHKLTILLGNHDVEMSLPGVRRVLLQTLTADRPARVEFVFDGEAYVTADVLIEHGNRYDGWNAVPYGALRAFKSSATRHEGNFDFEPPSGSRLVASVVNRLKSRYRFIDLLKPENETVIPILCALEPKLAFELASIVPLWRDMRKARGVSGRVREEETYIADGRMSAVTQTSVTMDNPMLERTVVASEAVLSEARAAAGELLKTENDGRVPLEDGRIAEGGEPWLESKLSLWRARALRPFQRYRLLAKAFSAHRKAISTSFDLSSEDPPYFTAASRLHAEGGARVVVFGHTHIAKAIRLGQSGRYLNTGTWCPTMRLPAAFYSDEPDDKTVAELEIFVDDLANNRTEPWTRLETLFAHIRVHGDGSTRAALCQVQTDGGIATVFSENS